MMNKHSEIRTNNDLYCQSCSSKTSSTNPKRFSSFSCNHCQTLMCYDCYENHQTKLMNEYIQLQKRFFQLTNSFQNKKQLYSTFQEHCLRSMNSIFDDIITDIENLRKESMDYVKQQFHETENILSNLMRNVQPSIYKSQDNLSETSNLINDLETQRQQINKIEKYFELFSTPNVRFQISTFPRNKFDLQCQLLSNSFESIKKFIPSYPGRLITTKCTCNQQTEYASEKIDVDTEVEEFYQIQLTTNQTQTDSNQESIPNNINNNNNNNVTNFNDEDEFFSIQDEKIELNSKNNSEYCLSKIYQSENIIGTQNEVDRLASDGEHVLYYSETSKSLCYIINITNDKQTKEITCRWPHYPILDLVYSPVSSQFVCATKTGVYTCSIDRTSASLTIDIQMQLTQHWSYIRLAADRKHLWIWTDTPRSSQLAIYSPKTFDLIQIFHLNDYPRFSDNSTSFCIENHLLATVFQYKHVINSTTYKKYFHVTLCDNTDLHEICTIRLGECDIDHEIRSNDEGKFFITNGKKILWIIDSKGQKEYVKLARTGRALTIMKNNQILIANGTQKIQCVELLSNT